MPRMLMKLRVEFLRDVIDQERAKRLKVVPSSSGSMIA